MSRPILVTRPAGQADELVALLEQRGVGAVSVPTVEIDTASAAEDLDAMLDGLAGADWLILTSANGAAALASRIVATGQELPAAIRVAAVGPATADALAGPGSASTTSRPTTSRWRSLKGSAISPAAASCSPAPTPPRRTCTGRW